MPETRKEFDVTHRDPDSSSRVSPRVRRLIPQLVIIIPTVAASLLLAQRGVPPLRRLITSAALGIILIVLMMAWRLSQRGRPQQ